LRSKPRVGQIEKHFDKRIDELEKHIDDIDIKIDNISAAVAEAPLVSSLSYLC